jgi:hypothetical protein
MESSLKKINKSMNCYFRIHENPHPKKCPENQGITTRVNTYITATATTTLK